MEMALENDYIRINSERETIYAFLKISLAEPLSAEIVSHWKESFTAEFIEAIAADNEYLRLFFEELKSSELADIVKQEKDSYLATFNLLNPTGKVLAPPWESVYVTRDQSMFGDPVFQIRERLQDFDLQYVDIHRDPEDHIAIELEFMGFLISYTMDAFKNCDEHKYEKGLYTQYWLHKEHFNHWIQPFTERILSSSTSNLYKGIAVLLNSFVAEDYEYIKSLKEGLENE